MEKVTAKNSDKSQLPSPSLFTIKKRFLAYILSLLIAVSAVLFLSYSLYAQETIDPHSGQLFLTATDLVIQAGPISLELERSLQTAEEQSGVLGSRWRLNWESHLVRSGTGALIQESTGPVYFKKEAGGDRFVSLSGDFLVVDKDGGAVRIRPDRMKFIYDAEGRLIETRDANTNQILIHYSKKGRIDRIEGPGGSRFVFTADDKGRITLVEASTGARAVYTYKGDTLAEVRINGGPPVKYLYNDKKELMLVERPQTGTVHLTYDAKGRVTKRRWSDESNESYEYDDSANTVRYINPEGSATTFRRSKDGRREEITDQSGNTTTIEYTEYHRPGAVTGPDGKTSRFAYDDLGRLVRATGCCGGEASFEYVQDTHLYQSITDSDGTRQEFTYDTAGNMLSIQQNGEIMQEFSYYPSGLLKSMKGLGSPPRHFSYYPNGLLQSQSNALKETTTYAYDKRGNLIRETDPLGGKTIWEHDEQDRLVNVTDPSGGKTSYEHDAAGRRVGATDPMGGRTRYAYDSRGRLLSMIDPEGRTTSYAYDSGDRMVRETDPSGGTYRYQYDLVGNLVREINPLGSIATWTYDALGQVISETDFGGGTWKYKYSNAGVLTQIIDPLGGVSEYKYDARRLLKAEIDQEGRKTRYEYDKKGLITKATFPDGLVTNYEYNKAGYLVRESDNRGVDTEYEYDGLGRFIKAKAANGLVISYRYDALDNLLGWWDNFGDSVNIQYNLQGLVSSMKDVTGASTRYRYDLYGRLLEAVNPLGHVTHMMYNAAGDLIRLKTPSGDITKYAYDSTGALRNIYHPGGGMTQFDYDQAGNRISVTDPLGANARSIYDTAGRLISYSDAKGQTTAYTYDANDRLTKKTLTDGKIVNYRYDASGNLVEADDGAFPVRYAYNPRGQLVHIEYPAVKRALKYEYDANGLLSTFTDSEGRSVHYEYNDRKLLIGIRLSEGKRITFSYDQKDRLTAMVYPNGVKGTWKYSVLGQVTQITYANRSGETLSSRKYAYDPAGNLIKTIDEEGKATKYSHDASDRLIKEDGPSGKLRYSYLSGGNRGTYEKKGSVVQYRYNRANQLLKAGKETFKYDANGNLVESRSPQGITRFYYDTLNQLVRIVKPDKTEVSYGYAPTGERIWRKDPSGATWFVTDGTNLLAELDENLKPKATYLHGPGIDRPLKMLKDGKNYFYHADILGSISALTDKDGNVSTSYKTDAFGNILGQMGTIHNPFIFTGREYEPDIDLYYYRARYYDPKHGRFLSKDPLWGPSSLNHYIYVWNNPTLYRDPMGLAAQDIYTRAGISRQEAFERVIKPAAEALKRSWDLGAPPEYRMPIQEAQKSAQRLLEGNLLDRGRLTGREVLKIEAESAQNSLLQIKIQERKLEVYNRLSPEGKAKMRAAAKLRSERFKEQFMRNLKTRKEAGGQQSARGASRQQSARGASRQPARDTSVIEGSPGRRPTETQVLQRPGVGRPSISNRIGKGLKRFVYGPHGKVMEIVQKHPGKIVLALSAAQYAACKSRGMSTEECIKETVITAGIGKGLGAAVGKVIVVLGPKYGPWAGKAFIVVGAIYGTYKIIEAGTEARKALLSEAERQKLLAAMAKQTRKLLEGQLEKTIGSTRKLINKELEGPRDSFQKACEAAKKHVQTAKSTARQAQQDKQTLAALASKIIAKSESSAALWADAHSKKGEIDGIYAKMSNYLNRVNRAISSASQLAQNCTSEQDGAKIKELYAAAKGLSEGMRKKTTDAANLNQKLKALKNKVCTVNTDLAKARATKDKIAKSAASFEELRGKARPDIDRAYELQMVLSKQCDAWIGRVDSLVKSLTYGLIDYGDFNLIERVESKFAPLIALINTLRNPNCKAPNLNDIDSYAAAANIANQDAAGIIQNIGTVDLELCKSMPSADSVVVQIETTAAFAWASVVKGQGLPQKAAQCGKKEEDLGSPFGEDSMAEMREKLLYDKEAGREGMKQARILSDSGNLSSKGKFTQKGMEKERKEIQDKILRPYTEPPQCTSNAECVIKYGEGWKCNKKTGKCEKEKLQTEVSDFRCGSNKGCWDRYGACNYYCEKATGECKKCLKNEHGKKDGTEGCNTGETVWPNCGPAKASTPEVSEPPETRGDVGYYLGRVVYYLRINNVPCQLRFYSCAECTEADMKELLSIARGEYKKIIGQTDGTDDEEACVRMSELIDAKLDVPQGPSKTPIQVPLPSTDCPCTETPAFQYHLKSEYNPDCMSYEKYKKAKPLLLRVIRGDDSISFEEFKKAME
jgi:RHS repeat-associated protein